MAAGRSGSGTGIKAGDAWVRFYADNSELVRGMQLAEAQLKAWGQRIQKLGRSLAAAGVAGAALFIKPIREAANVEQLLGRFDAVFGSIAKSAGEFADDLATKINQSGLTLRDQLAQFDAYLKGIGFDPSEAAQISKQLTEWTNDWIAFDDTIVNGQEAVDLFLSALSGEVRPARRMGADLRVMALDAEAAAKGMGEASEKLSEAQRVQLRLGIIGRALGRSGVIGQAAREVDTLAARFRGIKAALRDFAVAVGNAVLVPFSELIAKTIKFTRSLEEYVKVNPTVVTAFAKLSIAAIAAGAALEVLGRSIAALTIAKGLRQIVTYVGWIAANPLGAVLIGGAAVTAAAYANFLRITNSVESVTKAWNGLKEAVSGTAGVIKQELFAGDVLGAIESGFNGVIEAIAKFGKEIKGLEGPAFALITALDQINEVMGLIAGTLTKIREPIDFVTKQLFGATTGEGIKQYLELRAMLEELSRREKEALANTQGEFPTGGRRGSTFNPIAAGQEEVAAALEGTSPFVNVGQEENKTRMRRVEAAFESRRKVENEFQDLILGAIKNATYYPVRRRQALLLKEFIKDLPNKVGNYVDDVMSPWLYAFEQNERKFFGQPARAPSLATQDFNSRVSFGALGQTFGALQVGDAIDISEEQLEEQKKIRKAVEATNNWVRRNAGLPTNGE